MEREMPAYPQQQTYGETRKPARELNPEELQHLLNKLSSDESKELKDIMQSCTSEITLTRGVPFSALVVGSLYFARTRLPAQYHFGPKGWPFYAIMGIGSLTASNIFFMGKCKERVMPKIEQFWQKYQATDNKKMTYEHIRQQHRQGMSVPERHYTSLAETTYDTLRQEQRGQQPVSSSLDTFTYHPPESGFSSSPSAYEGERDEAATTRRPYSYQPYPDEPSFMSGTPSGASSLAGGYRDKDFS